MPTSMKQRWSKDRLEGAEMAGPFPFTNGFPVMRIPYKFPFEIAEPAAHQLYDLEKDPEKLKAISDEKIEARLCELIAREARRCQAPEEYFQKFGISV